MVQALMKIELSALLELILQTVQHLFYLKVFHRKSPCLIIARSQEYDGLIVSVPEAMHEKLSGNTIQRDLRHCTI